MLLKALYDFAISRDLLSKEAFQKKAVRWIIPLDSAGNLVGCGMEETEGNKNRGKGFSTPITFRSKVAGGVADFLADNLTSVFGLETEPEPEKKIIDARRKAREKNNQAKMEDFWRQITEAYEKTRDENLRAILLFKNNIGSNTVKLLRWGNAPEGKGDQKPCWWVKSAAGTEMKSGPDNFSFRVGTVLLLEDQNLQNYWKTQFSEERSQMDKASQRGICLITGESDVPIAATHNPKIKGVPGTQAFGAAIVSFDKDSFTSFGFDQSMNAPVSTRAVAAYTSALNWLLQRDDHSIKIGRVAACFWAKEQEQNASFFARMLMKPDPKAVIDFLKSPWAGIDREIATKDWFYSVTLSGNGGRIVVRNWLQRPLNEAVENLRNWFQDLEIVEFSANVKEAAKDKMPPLALFRLACSTVRDAKDIESSVISDLYQAAVQGTAPGISILKPVLNRLKIDLAEHGPVTLANISRFALVKLVLNRNRKENDPVIETRLFETDDPAYNCGRLLAVFDDLQMAAHEWELEGPGVVERYYGAASSAPNSAFGILWRLHQHHLRKVSRQGNKGRARAEGIKKRIAEIACRFKPAASNLPPAFPRVFNLQEQGRFAIGFYQEKAEMNLRRAEAKSASAEKAKTEPNNDRS